MSFENLDIWKRSSRLCADVYLGTQALKDFGFRDQLTALSVPSNIAEGMTRLSNKEKCRFLEIASSMAEARTQIYIGVEIGYFQGI